MKNVLCQLYFDSWCKYLPVNDIGKIYVYIQYIYDGGPAKWEMMSVLLLFKDANKERYKNKWKIAGITREKEWRGQD